MHCLRLLLILIATNLLIQINAIFAHGQMIPVRYNIATPYGNVPATYYVGAPRVYYNNNYRPKAEYKIVLKNDSTFSQRTRIDLRDKRYYITVKKNRKKIEINPNETKSITKMDFNGYSMTGIPTDSCWLFKVATGKINCYSPVAEPGMDFVNAIQDGPGGTILPLTADNLSSIMMDPDHKTMELVEKKKFVRAINRYNGNN